MFKESHFYFIFSKNFKLKKNKTKKNTWLSIFPGYSYLASGCLDKSVSAKGAAKTYISVIRMDHV